MSDVLSFAEQRRQETRAKAALIGIDEAYISLLVESFYDRIRADRVLGPIFDRVITGSWDSHLARMKDFWASVALSAGSYSGQPVPVHQRLSDVTPDHSERWLRLFAETLNETAPHPDVPDYFMLRARRIAESLKLAMFGVPELKTRELKARGVTATF